MHLPIAVVGFVAAFGLVRADGLEGVLARCCALGSDWARQRSYASCADFPPPVSSVPGEQLATCIASADICCRRDNRNTQCRRGSNAALADKRCSVDVAEHGEAYKDCCEACKLGMISGSLWQSCELKRFSFGLPWDAAFHECCAAASGTSSAATPPTSSNELLPPAANETLCSTMGHDLCAHVCVPTPGSYRCECHPGFGLMADGKSCKLLSGGPDRCKEENPCTHICRDTGLAVECSCRPGYVLQSDRKTCKDIDECQAGTHHCLLKTQTCRNDPGGYTCLGKDGVIIVPRVFEALDNALAPVGPGPQPGPGCPAGYQFNAQLAVCDDVDECASGLADCGRPEDCVNTVGSYRCDGSAQQGACPPGYVWEEAAQRCVDQDECEDGSNNCAEETQFCLNSQGGFACLERVQGRGSCPAGYKKDTTHRSGCKDVDECLEQIHDCEDETEVCRNTAGAYDCEPRACDRGYRLDPITRLCQDVDECEENGALCGAGQRCINTPGSFVCVPAAAATATAAPTAHTAHTAPTTQQTMARPDPRRPRPGACPSGFRAGASPGLCDDINECQEGSHSCRQDEVCVNELGRFRCERGRPSPTTPSPSTSCPQGYQFSRLHRQCVDVDECATGTHNCSPSERCVNEGGAFQCSPACEPGFRVRAAGRLTATVCEDIDECAEGLHSCLIASQRCRNTNGSFTCEDSPPCPSGYFRTPSGGCDDVNECLEGSTSCPAADLCVNTPGSFRCIASTTTTPRPTLPPARTTQWAAMPSTNRPSAPPPPSAQCPAGFRLSEAERRCLDVDECADAKLHICNNVTELCINEPGGYRCVKRDSPAPLSASPPAVPARPLGAGRCDPGYMYSFHNQKCVDEDECIRNPCDSNQVCHNTVGSYSCECKEGFARDPLTTACVDINECQLGINHCAASQRCDNTIGSYQCIRYSGCGTGYTLNAATGTCDDDDECELGTDNCRESGPTWVCRNTQGSFRCERKQCEPDYQLLPSGECVRIECDPGYAPAANTSKCVDIDECSIGSPCGRGRRCVNTPGSYQCVFRIQCRPGFVPSPEGDRCVDEDECATGTHNCKPGQTCFNRPGTYQCQCPPGHTLDETKNCVDVDECERFPRQACSDLATCENTVGSYRCHCKEGYRQGRGKSCDDIDECAETPNLCQQQCINVWGSYRCSCERGFYLHTDNRTCIDIDECQVHKDRHLCVGDCLNTLGSYRCHCPSGYRLSKDGRNCVDIDECATGEKCRQPGEICINMQGSFRCNTIRCPEGYVNDNSQKNRCRRIARGCPPNDHECRRQPQLMTFNFMTLVSNMSIPASGALDLFVMRGALTADTHTLFSLDLDSARAPVGVPAATRANFKLSQVRDNQAVVALVRPLAGPQDVELRLVMEVYSGSFLAGLNVAKLFLFVSEHPY